MCVYCRLEFLIFFFVQNSVILEETQLLELIDFMVCIPFKIGNKMSSFLSFHFPCYCLFDMLIFVST